MRAARRHMRAWLLLVGALAVHVIDEAVTGFRWLPGATSAPLLLVASVLLLRAARDRQRSDPARIQHAV